MKYIRYILIPIIVLIILTTVILFYKSKNNNREVSLERSNYEKIINLSSPVGGDPKPLQDFLIKEIKSGDKNNFTQSAAYWMSHRYFDNGGDIYEIYNYVKANPELNFLGEAELLESASFKLIEKGEVKNYSRESLAAYLAYLKVFDKYGYLNFPGLSTLTNKIVERAYFSKLILDAIPNKTIARIKGFSTYYDNQILESLKYQVKASSSLDKVMKGDISDFASKKDAIVGLTQYANALQFYKALRVDYVSIYTAEQVFDISIKMAEDTGLNYFVNYSRAVSTIITKEINSDIIKRPLAVVISYQGKNPVKDTVIYKIINSRISGEVGLYSYKNVATLGTYSPEFKSWLIERGWVDQDFEAIKLINAKELEKVKN